MCGLIAAFTQSPIPDVPMRNALERMVRRGPDDEGQWHERGVFLGHRRLAIVDLDPRAAQPMHSACGRYVIAFNGEIYNFRALRHALEARGKVFRTTSDTEVILALFAEQGETMLPQLHGMFAFVIWDRAAERAFAARDPYGIKPLYVATTPDGVMLASQVKALLATGLISRDPNPVGQAGFWMLGSVPEPHTWFRDIQAVRAGHCMWIERGGAVSARSWHDIGDAWRLAPPCAASAQEVREQVRAALCESVARHLVADVPVGVFLSGGIDSGTLAGLMVEAGARDLEGITVAYDEFAGRHEDEAPAAAEIAAHYGIGHYVRRVTRDEFLADLPRILDAIDQPTIDGINTWYASKAVAERGLKVVVSGVGGDELFMGYRTFRQLPRVVAWWRRLSGLPGAMPLARILAGVQAGRSGNSRWRHAPEWARTMECAWWLRRSVCGPEDALALMDTGVDLDLIREFDAATWMNAMTGRLARSPALAVAQMESMIYLRNQLLRDSDWSSMDHGVELRAPLVDAQLLLNVQSLLSRFAAFPNKSLLAVAPVKPLPSDIVMRRKTGFGIPVRRWLLESGAIGQGGSRTAWARKVVASYALQ